MNEICKKSEVLKLSKLCEKRSSEADKLAWTSWHKLHLVPQPQKMPRSAEKLPSSSCQDRLNVKSMWTPKRNLQGLWKAPVFKVAINTSLQQNKRNMIFVPQNELYRSTHGTRWVHLHMIKWIKQCLYDVCECMRACGGVCMSVCVRV